MTEEKPKQPTIDSDITKMSLGDLYTLRKSTKDGADTCIGTLYRSIGHRNLREIDNEIRKRLIGL